MLFIFLLVCLSEFVASVELSDWAMQSSAKLPSNITGFIISSPGFDTSSWSAAHKRVFHHQYYLGIQSLFLARFLLAWLKTTSIKICTWIKICWPSTLLNSMSLGGIRQPLRYPHCHQHRLQQYFSLELTIERMYTLMAEQWSPAHHIRWGHFATLSLISLDSSTLLELIH